MQAEIGHTGGPYGVEEALETIRALAGRTSRGALKAGNATLNGHRQMVAEWMLVLEPKEAC